MLFCSLLDSHIFHLFDIYHLSPCLLSSLYFWLIILFGRFFNSLFHLKCELLVKSSHTLNMYFFKSTKCIKLENVNYHDYVFGDQLYHQSYTKWHH